VIVDVRPRRSQAGRLCLRLPQLPAASPNAGYASSRRCTRAGDQHRNLNSQLKIQPLMTSTRRQRRSSRTWKQRGLLEDTLVIWGGRVWSHALPAGQDRRRETVGPQTIAPMRSRSGWLAAA
jgi:hypothetical protein